MKKLSKFIICLIVFTTYNVVYAGPFGLEMGISLIQIDSNAKEIAPFLYKITSVPKPYSAFETYVVKVTKHCRLCWIKAVGKDISTNSYGALLSAAFYDMKGKLEKAYEKHKTVDALLPGSIWD